MEASVTRPETIDKLRYAVDAGFAMLAGMQLDVLRHSKMALRPSKRSLRRSE